MISSKLAIKLWGSIVDQGIGKLFKPLQMKREGITNIELKRIRMLVLAQTERDVEDIKKGEKVVLLDEISNPKVVSSFDPSKISYDGKVEPVIDISSLMLSARNDLYANEIQKEINIARSLIVAESILSEDYSEPSEDQIEKDWLGRWRDNAATTSSEELQELWGRVLAGEVKNPGKYSLRTLDFIRNLTQREAISLQKLFSFELADGIITPVINRPVDHPIAKELNYPFIAEMRYLGVIDNSDSRINISSMTPDYFAAIISYDGNKKGIGITNDNKDKTVFFNICSLTPLGVELKSLCNSTIDSRQLDFVVETLKQQEFNVYLGDIVIEDDNTILLKNQMKQ